MVEAAIVATSMAASDMGVPKASETSHWERI